MSTANSSFRVSVSFVLSRVSEIQHKIASGGKFLDFKFPRQHRNPKHKYQEDFSKCTWSSGGLRESRRGLSQPDSLLPTLGGRLPMLLLMGTLRGISKRPWGIEFAFPVTPTPWSSCLLLFPLHFQINHLPFKKKKKREANHSLCDTFHPLMAQGSCVVCCSL